MVVIMPHWDAAICPNTNCLAIVIHYRSVHSSCTCASQRWLCCSQFGVTLLSGEADMHWLVNLWYYITSYNIFFNVCPLAKVPRAFAMQEAFRDELWELRLRLTHDD